MKKVSQLFHPELFFLDVEVKDKEDLLKTMSKEITSKGYCSDDKALYKEFEKREKEFATSIGSFIAIPHAIIPEIKENVIVFARLKNYIKWQSLDTLDVKYVFIICVKDSDQAAKEHMAILSGLSKKFMEEKSRKRIDDAQTVKDLKKIF